MNERGKKLMKKFIKIKFLMVLTICIVSAASIFCAGQNTLSAHAYTDEEIAQAKEWLAANGYSPSRAGAEQAYQDYLNGKFGPVPGTETPPAENTPPADNTSQEAGTENADAVTPENGAEQANEDAGTDTEQPSPDAAADTEQPADAEIQPKTEKKADTAAENSKETSDTAADAKKKDTASDEDTKKNGVSSVAASKNNNSSSTGTQKKNTVTDTSSKSLTADGTGETADSAIDLASAAETPEAAGAAGTAALNTPAEATGNSYMIIVVAVILIAAVSLCLAIYLRKKNERTAS